MLQIHFQYALPFNLSCMCISEQWKKKVEGEKDWFAQDKWMSNESMRVIKRNSDIFPKMEGSFRSLSID